MTKTGKQESSCYSAPSSSSPASAPVLLLLLLLLVLVRLLQRGVGVLLLRLLL